MGRLHVDFLGPLFESTTGNTNKLVIVDLFTKLVECVPLPSQTAEVTASEAMYIFFARFSFPSTSSQTKAENLEANFSNPYVNKMLQIHKRHTMSYRPSAKVRLKVSTKPSWTLHDVSLVNQWTIWMNTCRNLPVQSDHMSTEIQVLHQIT